MAFPCQVAEEMVPELMFIPLMVLETGAVICPEELTWKAFPVPTARVPAMSVLPEPEITENLAEAVDVPPTARSLVILRGDRTPEFNWKKLVPELFVQAGTPPTMDKTWFSEPAVRAERVLGADAISISPVAKEETPVPP